MLTRPAEPTRPHQEKLARPYQQEAIRDTVAALRQGGRAQAHMACGSGKTLVALRVAEQAAPGSTLTVALAPTIALVAQMLDDFRADAELPFAALAVCSDDTAVDAPVHLDDLHVRATTDRAEVVDWLRMTARRSGPGAGRRYVFATYVSASVVAAALAELAIQADLLICDEAHHLTGAIDAPVRRVAVDPDFLPARRRLFATATPRFDMRVTAVVEKAGMDDESLFGPRTAYYPFHQAIADGHLKDYRVAVIGVTEAEIRALLTDKSTRYLEGYGSAELRTLATQVAVAKAQTMFQFRRVITFHYRVEDAAEFARTLKRTLDRLPLDQRPEGELYAGHVNGMQRIDQRDLVLRHLHHPPSGGWTVVSNARCLGEGVNIPAVDAVVFGHAKRSAVDIVQAVGRALRGHREGSGDPESKATIVVPIVVPQDQGEVVDLDPREYTLLWNVIRALRAHDEELGISLDMHRERGLGDQQPLPDKITMVLSPGTADHVLNQLTVLLIRQTTSPWWESYGAAVRFHTAHGHLLPPKTWADPVTGTPLAVWLSGQRTLHRQGRMLPERRAMLDQLGMVWEPKLALWGESLAAVKGYRAEHGHLRVPVDHVTATGFPLGQRLAQWVHRHRQGTLATQPAEALEALGIEWNDHIDDAFERGLAHARRYHAHHGHLRATLAYVTNDGFALGRWVAKERDRRDRRSPEQIAALDALGMMWKFGWAEGLWQRGLAVATAYRAQHGHLRVPKGHVTPTNHAIPDFPLGEWIGSRRVEHGRGTLPADRVEALNALGMIWDTKRAAWEENYALAAEFYRTRHHLDVPHAYRDSDTGAKVGAWVLHQRQRRSGVKPGGIGADEIARLDQIGMNWTGLKPRTRAAE